MNTSDLFLLMRNELHISDRIDFLILSILALISGKRITNVFIFKIWVCDCHALIVLAYLLAKGKPVSKQAENDYLIP